jgi:hypothetical protein
MIIEFFGPPASGKTTLAHALADRLRERGYMAKVILCYQPRSRGGVWNLFGFIAIIYRIFSALFSNIAIIISSIKTRFEFKISIGLIKLIPPKSIIWRVRICQYIIRLSSCWKRARQSTDITIFDQGFVQAVGSLAMFNGAAEDTLIAQALRFAPQADLIVRIVVPRDVVETRLRARMMCEPAAERLFEVDVADNMNSFRVFEDIGDVLSRAHRNVVPIQAIDQQSTLSGLCRVEEEILARLSKIKPPVIKGRRNELPTRRRHRKSEV